MRIVTLLENTAAEPGLAAAHGLSLYIETPRHAILMDTGPDEGFLANAERLGIDLSRVDVMVLSHGHYDHGGGLRAFCGVNRRAKLYLRRGAFGDYCALEEDGTIRPIGIDPTLREFEDRIVWIEERLRIDEELLLFSDVPDRSGALAASAKLRERTAAGLVRDAFAHEQNLLITAQGASVLAAGCAHRGIVNILRCAKEELGHAPDAVFGGFHLFQLKEGDPEGERLIWEIGEALRREENTVYYTGHCTGQRAYEKLKEMLGERLRRMTGGAAAEIPPAEER